MYKYRSLHPIYFLLCLVLFTNGCTSPDEAPDVYYHSIFLYNDTDYDVEIEYHIYSLDWSVFLGEFIGIYSLATTSIDLNARDSIYLTVASFDPTWGKYVVVYGDVRVTFEFADEFKTIHIHPMDLEE